MYTVLGRTYTSITFLLPFPEQRTKHQFVHSSQNSVRCSRKDDFMPQPPDLDIFRRLILTFTKCFRTEQCSSLFRMFQTDCNVLSLWHVERQYDARHDLDLLTHAMNRALYWFNEHMTQMRRRSLVSRSIGQQVTTCTARNAVVVGGAYITTYTIISPDEDLTQRLRIWRDQGLLEAMQYLHERH